MELKNKIVMVTGGAGFIGSNLTRYLLKEGAKVVVYDNFSSGDMANLEEIKNEIKVIKGDILDSNIESLLSNEGIECVFHLAAEPYIPHCYERPKSFFDVNATGTLNLILACKKADVERILQYSSSEVYGTAQRVPMDENHPLCPQSTYAVSKLAADRLCQTLYYEQNLPVIILREFNVFGPRETQPYIIPELISQLSVTNKLTLGNIKARRDFLYVDDAVRGAISLMKSDKAVGQVVNLGSGKDYSIEEIAKIIGRILSNSDIKVTVEKNRLRPWDVERLLCNYGKMTELTGWKPEIGFEEGLKKLINWYQKNSKKWIWETKFAPESEIWQKGSCSKK